MRIVERAVATVATAVALAGAGAYAYAAPVAGDERTGTWTALGIAALVALVAGVVSALGPSREY